MTRIDGDPIADACRRLSSMVRRTLAVLYGYRILLHGGGISLAQVHVAILRRTSRRRVPVEEAEVHATLVDMRRIGLCESTGGPAPSGEMWRLTSRGRAIHVLGKEIAPLRGRRRTVDDLGGEAIRAEDGVRRAAMIWMLVTAGCGAREIGEQMGLSASRVSEISRDHGSEIHARVAMVRVRGPRPGEEAEAALMRRLRRAGALPPRIGPADLARLEIERQRFLFDRWWEDERFGVGVVDRS